jgi:cyclic pyranopterin phosphate synthase
MPPATRPIDMIKAVDRAATITDVRVEKKTGGRSGTWRRGVRSQ